MRALRKCYTGGPLRGLALIFSLSLSPAYQIFADWPQFLGTNRDASAVDSPKLSRSFPLDGPEVNWRFPVGAGFAGPVVADGRVFIFHRMGGECRLQALAARTGEVTWTYSYPATYEDSFGFDEGPRSCPTVAGPRVFAYGAEGMLVGVDCAHGELLWKRDLKVEFESPQGFFGRCCAPLVVGNAVIVSCGGTQQDQPGGVAAFDVATGNVLWRVGPGEAGYASPLLWKAKREDCALFFTREGLLGLDPKTGKELLNQHFRSEMEASVNASTPVLLGSDRFFVSACYGVGAAVWKRTETGLEAVWKKEGILDCHYGTPVLQQGFLYGFHGRQESGQELRCVDPTDGSVKWSSGRKAAGEIIAADGMLIVLNEKGELMLVEPSPKEFKIIAQAQILGAGHRSPPALAGGVLYARDKKQLVAVKLTP